MQAQTGTMRTSTVADEVVALFQLQNTNNFIQHIIGVRGSPPGGEAVFMLFQN